VLSAIAALETRIAQGNQTEVSSASKTKSRPSPIEEEAPRYWIGFDLGGTKMQCALFDRKMKKIAQQKRRTRQELGVQGGLDRIVETIRRVLNEAKIDETQISGIGIGCPGPVEWDTGVVRVAVNLGWQNVKVGQFLSKRFECPVEVLNDVDAGVYGEHVAGAGVGARTTVGIFPGTGIGGGCVYDGQILRGKHLSCMEIGHIKISGSPRQGGSNMTGTLEAEASRLALAGELAKLAYRGEAPNLYKAVGTDIGSIRSRVIFEAIAAGDTEVEKAMAVACEAIGHSIANIVLLMCPDCIVLGGGLVESMPERFLKLITSVAKSSIFECYRDQFEVKVAKLGDDAGVIGCASWVAKSVEEKGS
jgi:glucokinase